MTIPSDLFRSCRLGLMAMLALVLPIAAQAETVTISAGIQVAYEEGPVSGSFVVSRDGQDPLTVTIKAPTGTAAGPWLGLGFRDYTVSGMTPITDGSTGYTISFLQGENNKVIGIIPDNDATIEGREAITLEIATSGLYITGAPNSAQISIADNDIILSIDTPDPVADEDVTLNGLVGDSFIRRRGVMRAQFEDVLGNPVDPFDRNLAVRLSGTATFTGDYALKYRICGSTTGTGTSSKIGFNTTPASELTTGLGYQIVAHRVGESFIWVQGIGSVASGGDIRFNSNPGQLYDLPDGFTGSSSGPVLIRIVPALTANLVNGTGVTITAGASVIDPPSMVVSRTYPAGTTQVEVANGSGGIFIGDVFAVGTDQNVLYVATSDVVGSAGTLDFRCYLNGSSGGLDKDVSQTTNLNTLLSPTVSANAFNVVVPQESTRFEMSIEPSADGVVEGREVVNVTLLASEDYAISNPTVAQVAIADRDATADIQLLSNASKPGTTGSFALTLTRPFPIALTIPYIVTGTAVPGDVANATTEPYVDYGALTPGVTGSVAGPAYVPYAGSYSGSITIPPGQTTAFIPVVPGTGGSTALPTPTLIVTLNSTLDYKLSGSSGSGVNPSATMSIGASLGSASVTATDASALETPSPSASTTGAFSVNLNRLGPPTSAVGVTIRVSGSATYLSRYSLQVGGSPLALTAAGAGIHTAVVTIASGTSSTLVTVVPIDNFLADGSQSVVVEVLAGQNYTQTSTAPAVVTIADDEPVLSVIVGQNASKPTTAGHFVIGYSGAALTHSVAINFSLAGGTAVLGTDYSASSTLVIPAGANSAQFVINPLVTADDANTTVIFTLTNSNEYTIGSLNTATMTIAPATTSAGTKPTPGTINTGGSGGCGLGSGIATLAGLGFLALRLSLIRRRRRD